MLPNRIAIYAFAVAALAAGLSPIWADLDWESTTGVIAAIGTLAGVLYKWLDGWQSYEERTDLEHRPESGVVDPVEPPRLMFTAYPAYSPYRSLRLTASRMHGEDVYALQTGLNEILAVDADPDGVFGPATKAAVEAGQRSLDIGADGVCGPETWLRLVDTIARRYRVTHKVAVGALYGSLSHESSMRGGNYSPQRPDHSYDAGVAQMNTRFTPPEKAFAIPFAVGRLAANTSEFYKLFDGVRDERRRWNLAQGAWNAPAFACFYARREGATRVGGSQTATPGPTAAEAFADYLASVGAYLRV